MLEVVPEINWVWTLGLAFTGVLIILLNGVDKVSIAVGPFFLIAAGLSVLRQTDRLNVNLEVPILVIAAGVLLLISRSKFIPPPKWLLESNKG